MTKKTYIQPSISVVNLQHQPLLQITSVQTYSTSNDVVLEYDDNGGNAGEAW